MEIPEYNYDAAAGSRVESNIAARGQVSNVSNTKNVQGNAQSC